MPTQGSVKVDLNETGHALFKVSLATTQKHRSNGSDQDLEAWLADAIQRGLNMGWSATLLGKIVALSIERGARG